METPSPTDRRQAWVRRSQHWLTVEETVPQGARTSPVQCSDTLPDVFAEGCAAGKIESWLQDCGPEVGSEDPSHQTLEPLVKTGGSFEDNLSLGAEATALNIEDDGLGIGHCSLLQPPPSRRHKGPSTSTPHQKFSLPFLDLGHSMGSSCFSSATSKTASSVSEVLELCAEDAEETLYQLGFGCDEPQVTAHIPARFFSFPSQLRGINFRLFLESQLGRLHQEDPDLSLASRFRQVEVLTAMANAFYSLYSHVSRTPLQKLAPPDASFSPSPVDTKIAPRFFSNVRSEPRSPVERLKDTVSKMCLYTGPSFRSFDLASPRKPGSLPDLVEAVMDNGKSAQQGAAKPSVDRDEGAGESIERHGDGEKEVAVEGVQNRDREEDTGIATETHTNGTRISRTGPGPRRRILDPVDPGPSSPEVAQRLSHPPLALGAKFTHDVICPQIAESVHQMILNCPPRRDRPTSPTGVLNKNDQRHGRSIPPSGAQLGLTEESAPGVASLETAAKATEDESRVGGGPQHRPRALSTYSESGCRITVTGWEGDVVSSPPGVQLDCCAYTPTDSSGSQPHPKQNLLIPVKHPALGQGTHSPQQANSFEMEEVHSIEEYPAQPEATHLTTSSWPSAVTQSDLLLREESLQSDSSGYAEEDDQTAPFS